jgi:hypothetical protein
MVPDEVLAELRAQLQRMQILASRVPLN